MTPVELAAELVVEAKVLRASLCRTWRRPERGTCWELTPDQVEAARRRWRTGGLAQAYHATLEYAATARSAR